MNWMHESLGMNNYFVLVYSVVDVAYIAISTQYNTIQYNIKTYNAPYVTKMLFVGAEIPHTSVIVPGRTWSTMILSSVDASLLVTHKPTAPSSLFHNANDPFTSPTTPAMILSSKVIGFVDLNTTGSAVGIEPTQLNILIQEPVMALHTKVIVVIYKCISAVNFLKQLDMNTLHLVHPVVYHHHYLLGTEATVCEKRSSVNIDSSAASTASPCISIR